MRKIVLCGVLVLFSVTSALAQAQMKTPNAQTIDQDIGAQTVKPNAQTIDQDIGAQTISLLNHRVP